MPAEEEISSEPDEDITQEPVQEELQVAVSMPSPLIPAPAQTPSAAEHIGALTKFVQDKGIGSAAEMEDVIREAKFALQRVGGADPELLEAIAKLFTAYQTQVDTLNKAEMMERRFKMQIELEKFKAEMKMQVAEHKNKLDIEKKKALGNGGTYIQQNFVTFDPQKAVG